MSLSLFAAFVAATAALMLIPGPNVALIVANSLRFGVPGGLVTVLGTSAAMVVQLAVASLGVTTLLGTMGHAFEALRWLGVGYLVILGVRAWRAPADDLALTDAVPAGRTFGRGFLVSLTNPKTLAFYAAFLPQFLDPAAPPGRQMAILGATFVAIALVVDGGWAVLAARARAALLRFGRARNRLTGAVLIGAAAGLAFARR
ncbi:threonine/homoserine/homoserine lactone efflux protein [Roseiarcus fermentans]|uniref:Threonine/homoserine/homoserine lactone efflux protein n=1 Tax=Roseiarcus fermentans TaxID=1473586 RepID=A0A366EXG6_9HYPH|nr:LysE family translocator [Roseiarcus fermentans]RBP07078.1 threonine/homoserine/homoserine lactone efflux protein [Roseiarcus fermentans]